jgi:hypothetical protein
LAPGFFAGAPTFDLPDPPGLLIVPPHESPTVGTEEIDGTSYTSQRHEFSVFAKRRGELTIPPFTVRFHFKRQPLDKDAVPVAVSTVALKFTAKAPPGTENLGGIISARNLTVTESWKPEAVSGKVGDAFTRTIVFSAPEIPAMAFPPFPAAKVDGLGVYPKPPEILDRSERGELNGERHDRITYVCQRAGRFVIPAAKLTWFDLDANQLRTIDFAARMLEIAPNSSMPTAKQAAHWDLRTMVPFFLWAVAGLGCAWIVRRNWLRWVAPFRPVHLAPLNPPNP